MLKTEEFYFSKLEYLDYINSKKMHPNKTDKRSIKFK